MARLRTARAARADIREITTYSKSAFGAQATRDYLAGLTAIFELFERRPLIGAEEGNLGIGMRSFRFRSHRIYYRLEDEALLLVRVLHHARDVSDAFGADQ